MFDSVEANACIARAAPVQSALMPLTHDQLPNDIATLKRLLIEQVARSVALDAELPTATA